MEKEDRSRHQIIRVSTKVSEEFEAIVKEQDSKSNILFYTYLSKEDIREKDIYTLKEYLEGVDNAIENLLKMSVKKNNINEIMFLQNFSSRIYYIRGLILQRLKEIETSEELKKIAPQENFVSERNTQTQIGKLLEMNEKWQTLLIENEQAKKETQIAIDKKSEEIALRREERETLKEKWAILRSFLERESVSTIVGAFLLIFITISLIIATFTRTSIPEIINNGFLVLLGYFFGQTVAKASIQDKDKKPDVNDP